MTRPLVEDTDRLRESLAVARFTRAGIVSELGRDVAEAINNYDPRTALSRLDGNDPLRTLTRLFLCGQTETIEAVAAALPLEDCLAGGLVERHRDGIRAAVHLHPYENWWVIADLPRYLRPGNSRPDRVLDVGPTSTNLAASAVRAPVGTALDIGTGCGVQSLHLSTHAARVTAIDLSARAVRFAKATAALNGLDWEVLHGDLAEPVAGRRFDLVLSNPPYIVGTGDVTCLYRDSSLPGDALCARLAGAAADLLTEGGVLQFAANWAHVRGQDWTDRVAGWFDGAKLDAWIVQDHISAPESYVDFWSADGGDTDPRRREAWLEYFRANDIEAIGSGLITLRNSGRADPVVRIEESGRPRGAEIETWLHRHDWLRDNDVLAARYLRADGVTLWQEGAPGEDGWQLRRQLLTLAGRTAEADPLMVAIAGGADGSRPLRDHLAALAREHGLGHEEVTEAARTAVTRLVEQGVIVPAGHCTQNSLPSGSSMTMQ